MKHIITALFTWAVWSATAQITDSLGTDTLIRYHEKTPDELAGKTKKWPVVRYVFQEDYSGTGRGQFKNPENNWKKEDLLIAPSIRAVGVDTLLLKFKAVEDWKTDIELSRSNHTSMDVWLISVSKKPSPIRVALDGKIVEQGWDWEILIGKAWYQPFVERTRPFQFWATFYRE